MRFVVPGRIKGKQRPFFSTKDGVMRTFTPRSTSASEGVVKHFAMEAMKGRALFEGPLWLSATVYLLQPASWTKKRKAETTYVTGRPDIDNICKTICDALNGIVWVDDAQLADAHIVRKFTTEAERVEIEIGRCVSDYSASWNEIERAAQAFDEKVRAANFRVLSKDEVEAA
jgi:Holliday junction resolvase RusA-like endonuclease